VADAAQESIVSRAWGVVAPKEKPLVQIDLDPIAEAEVQPLDLLPARDDHFPGEDRIPRKIEAMSSGEVSEPRVRLQVGPAKAREVRLSESDLVRQEALRESVRDPPGRNNALRSAFNPAGPPFEGR